MATETRDQRAIAALRDFEHCPRFIPEEGEGCDGMEGCNDCLERGARAVVQAVTSEFWDQQPAIAEVLKLHVPAFDPVNRRIRCACGLELHFIDARAWHRHAAAMVVGVLLPSPSAVPSAETPGGATPVPGGTDR